MQISIKLANDAKEQFSGFIDDHVPENREKFSSFAKFDQRLDTFISQFLPNKEYESLWEVWIIVFCQVSTWGSILGPFLLNINDFPDVICNIAIYIDDTTLYSKCDKTSDLWQQLE